MTNHSEDSRREHRPSVGSQVRVVVWPLVLLLCGIAVAYRAAWLEHRAADARQREAVRAELEPIRSALSRELFGAIQLTEGIAGLIAIEGGISEEKFRAFAVELLQRSDLIRNVVVAPGNVIKFVVPVEGNEQLAGLDYARNPEQWPSVARMMEERRLVVAGPVALVQGGIGVIGRTPIYVRNPSGDSDARRYWGLTSTVLEFDRLLARTPVAATSQRLMIALRGVDGLGERGAVFWGDGAVFDSSPVTVDVPLPSGSWRLAGIPRGGWPAFNALAAPLFQAGGIVSGLLATLLLLLLRTGHARVREVEQRRRTEAALVEREQKYRELVEHANSIILRWNAEGRVTFLNEFGQRFFGYTAAEIVGQHVIGTIVPATDSAGHDLRRQMEEISADPAAFERSNNENMRRNGERAWIAWTNRVVRDSQGRVTEILSVGTDITERKRARDELRRREEQLRLIMENLTDLVAVLDLDGHRLYNSPSYGSILGSPEQLRGTSSFDQIHPEDQARVRQEFAETVRTGIGRRLEYRLVDQRGESRYIESQGSVIRDTNGRVGQVIVVSRDITERRRVEELARSERQFSETMIESMPGVLYFYDDRGRFLRWNRNFEIVSGYSGEEIARMHPLEFFLPEDQPGVRERIEDVFTRGESSVEASFRAKDGSTIPYFFTGRNVVYNGKACLVGMGIDISERKQAELALRESEHRYRTTLDSILEGCQLIGFDWRYLYLNGAAAVHNRRPNAELLGRVMPEAWPGIEQTPVFSLLRRCLEERVPFHEEVEFGFLDGTKGWFDVRAQPVPEGMLVLSIAITERRQAEMALRVLNQTLESEVTERTAELKAALVRAEAADRIKSAFLATMSHELRTPLNSIIGFTGIVLQGLAGPLNPEQTKQLGMVRSSARHLLELINDVLDISKIEAGQLEVHAEPFELMASIERVVGLVRPLAEKKGLALTVKAPSALPTMSSDRRRVEQILINLLNNAIKFTERGSVTLAIELTADYRRALESPPCAAVRLRVIDTGIGIKPGNLALLFQPFRQLDTGLTRQHEGTGLGLAICRRLADLLGGDISADSQWQHGSEFTATLPVHKPN